MALKYHNHLITGGAGFIGSNLASSLLQKGCQVTIYDNLSRQNVQKNLQWLQQYNNGNLKIIIGDVRDKSKIARVIPGHEVIYHLAAQVAVITSIDDPIEDFESNLIGTFNMLEKMRILSPKSILIFSSTNKVYGSMEGIKLFEEEKKYRFMDTNLVNGVDETFPLDFHSPYGCSKGSADQYVIDYHRIYGLKTIVFRQSCTYGRRQFGSEEQGWIFHFLKQALSNKAITIFGNGKQVRDILYVDDLIDAYLAATDRVDITSGEAYNIGGGAQNALSLLESLAEIERILGRSIEFCFKEWRPGDQKIFISNNTKAKKHFGWEPTIGYKEGLNKTRDWTEEVLNSTPSV